jgi:hypothetical protein
MTRIQTIVVVVAAVLTAGAGPVFAQWPKFKEAGVPRVRRAACLWKGERLGPLTANPICPATG